MEPEIDCKLQSNSRSVVEEGTAEALPIVKLGVEEEGVTSAREYAVDRG